MTQLETPTGQESLVSTTNAVHAKAIEIGKYAIEMTTASGSGHPSTGLAIAHIIVELMYRQMRYDPRDPWNPGSDRLVLSIGHGVPIIYAAYADLGGTVGKVGKAGAASNRALRLTSWLQTDATHPLAAHTTAGASTRTSTSSWYPGVYKILTAAGPAREAQSAIRRSPIPAG